jgi:hypothetical protein
VEGGGAGTDGMDYWQGTESGQVGMTDCGARVCTPHRGHMAAGANSSGQGGTAVWLLPPTNCVDEVGRGRYNTMLHYATN